MVYAENWNYMRHKSDNRKSGNCKKTCRTAGAVVLAIVMSFSLAACQFSKKDKSAITPGSAILPIASKAQEESGQEVNYDEIRLTGVLTYINTDSKKMHYMDVSSGNEYEVAFSGGSDIRSRYDTIITTAKLQLGTIYDVICNKDGWAVSIKESSDAWKISEITGFTADENEQVATVKSKTYKYAKNAVVLSGTDRIIPSEIMKSDVVTVCGIDRTVYSVSVDRGHGYLKLTGIDDFIGGYVDVGTTLVTVISKDMLITVPEGEYKVMVENMSRTLSGSKTVKIEKDTDVTLDFSEYRTEAVKSGLVEFSVTPAGAVMYIDGTQVAYDEPISLEYGRHTVILKANQYLSYEEVFYVKQSYEKKIIDMSISKSTASTKSSSASWQTSASTKSNGASQQSSGSSDSGIVNGTVKNLTQGYYVNIKGPQGAAVYVNNSYVGIAPVSVDKKAGTMVIALTQAGRQTTSYSVEIPNATGDINYTFPELALKDAVTEAATASPAALSSGAMSETAGTG